MRVGRQRPLLCRGARSGRRLVRGRERRRSVHARHRRLRHARSAAAQAARRFRRAAAQRGARSMPCARPSTTRAAHCRAAPRCWRSAIGSTSTRRRPLAARAWRALRLHGAGRARSVVRRACRWRASFACAAPKAATFARTSASANATRTARAVREREAALLEHFAIANWRTGLLYEERRLRLDRAARSDCVSARRATMSVRSSGLAVRRNRRRRRLSRCYTHVVLAAANDRRAISPIPTSSFSSQRLKPRAWIPRALTIA